MLPEAEHPDSEVRDEEIYRIEQILICSRICCYDSTESAQPWEEPCMMILCLWMMIEFCEYCYSPHDFYESIGCDEWYIEPTLCHIESSQDFRVMICYDPKKKAYHRYLEIDILESCKAYESMTKREDDHDELWDREYERECYSRDTSELIRSDEYADSRYLIEEPSDDIGLCPPIEYRPDISHHR